MAKSTKVAAVATKVTKSTTKSAAKVAAKSYAAAYREGGSYHAVVACLEKLNAVGKFVSAADLLKLYPSVVGADAWKAFKAKDKRNDETGKGATDRVIQNAIVICRQDQYGNPLRILGVECRKQRDDKGYSFGLFKIAPLAVAPKVAAQTVASKPQTAAKASGSKAKAKTAPKAAKAVKTSGKAKGKSSK